MADYLRDDLFDALRAVPYSGALEDMMLEYLDTLGTGNSITDLLYSIDPTYTSLELYIRTNDPSAI